jgi:hypothetical protein
MAKLLLAPSEIHRVRYVKNKSLGMSTEQIAREEGISERFIKQSIASVEAFKALTTLEELESSQVEVVLFNKDLEKLALRNALQAKTVIYNEATGKKISEQPNHEIQLEAVKVIADITDNLVGSKKGVPAGGSTTNVNILNAPGSAGVGIATFEDRLREVKRKRGLLEQNNPSSSDSDSEIEAEEFTPDWEGPIVEQSSA